MNKLTQNTMVKMQFLIVLVAFLAGCKVEPKQNLPKRNYTLVWSDEFDGAINSLPDATKWTYDIGTGSNGWGNNELQTYTKAPENVSQDGNGNLVIKVIKNPAGGYTSARLKTEGIFTQKFGKIEARIKTPSGQGIWPAFWMLGENISAVGWPKCGEIDIMEQKGQEPFITYGSLHGPDYYGGNAITNSYRLLNGRFDTEFYTYSVEWGENYIDFFLNDNLYKRVTPSDATGEWVYTQPFFLLLNVAVGGGFAGNPTANTRFPVSMSIDYVRVYKEL